MRVVLVMSSSFIAWRQLFFWPFLFNLLLASFLLFLLIFFFASFLFFLLIFLEARQRRLQRRRDNEGFFCLQKRRKSIITLPHMFKHWPLPQMLFICENVSSDTLWSQGTRPINSFGGKNTGSPDAYQNMT